MKSSKPFWQSKTVGFNLVAILGFVGTALVQAGDSGLLPIHYAAVAAAVGNLILRYVTKDQITLSV